MKPYGSIYLITNALDGKRYIGQTTLAPAVRWARHKADAAGTKRNAHILQALRKYGAENFTFMVVGQADDQFELDALERDWIKALRLQECGYNLECGGSGGPMSEQTRLKISRVLKGRVISPAQRLQISAFQKGRPKSDEMKRKLQATNKGKKPSEASRRGVAEANRRRVHSPETRQKLKAANAKAQVARRLLGTSMKTREKLRAAARRNPVKRNAITGQFSTST